MNKKGVASKWLRDIITYGEEMLKAYNELHPGDSGSVYHRMTVVQVVSSAKDHAKSPLSRRYPVKIVKPSLKKSNEASKRGDINTMHDIDKAMLNALHQSGHIKQPVL